MTHEALTAKQGLDMEVFHGQRPATRLAELAPDAPPALARLVDSLLSPTREARPRSAEWVAIELERLRGDVAGVRREGDFIYSESVVLRGRSGTLRRIVSEHLTSKWL